jgi:hypothetical protein
VDLDYRAKFYIQFRIQDGLGIIRSVGALAEKHGVSLYTILQNPSIKIRRTSSFYVTTDASCVSAVTAMVLRRRRKISVAVSPIPLQLNGIKYKGGGMQYGTRCGK